jgi:putative addiction module killer protein
VRCRQPSHQHYTTLKGQDLFAQWLEKSRDRHAQARIAAGLLRLQNGNFGDCRFVDAGVWEQKIDWGSG